MIFFIIGLIVGAFCLWMFAELLVDHDDEDDRDDEQDQ